MRGAWISGGVVALALACSESPFTCDDDGDCSGLGEGVCEADGFCSVPDDTCPSRRRYAARSGRRSHRCVDADVAEGGASTDTGTVATTSGAIEPTTTTSPPTDSEGIGEASSVGLDSTGAGSASTGEPGGDGLILRVAFDDPSFATIGGATDDGPFGLPVSCAGDGCPMPTIGILGGAAAFAGSQRLEILGSGPLDVAGDLTIAVWVRDLTTDGASTRVIFSRLVGSGYAASYEIDFFDSMIVAAIAASDGTQVLATVPYADPNPQWVHLALVVDGAVLRLYRNAQEIASAPAVAIGYQDAPLVVGCDEDANGDYNDYFTGELDDLRMYDRALSQVELATILAGV